MLRAWGGRLGDVVREEVHVMDELGRIRAGRLGGVESKHASLTPFPRP